MKGLLAIKDRELLEIITRIDDRISISDEARKTAAEIRAAMAPAGKSPPDLGLGPMPTDMCRVNPFFPIARDDLHQRNYLKDEIITQSSWGEIKYSGPKLSIYDEDILLAVLALVDDIKARKKTIVEGRETYTYEGAFLPLLKLTGYKSIGKKEYQRAYKSLKSLAGAVVEFHIYGKNNKGKRVELRTTTFAMLSMANWEKQKKKLTVTVNPYFYECLCSGRITLLDMKIRAGISSPIAKSLYRFIQSHRDYCWQGRYLTVAAALNINLEQPQKQIRRLLNKAIDELKSKEILSAQSVLDDDIIHLHRLPPKIVSFKNNN